MADRYITTAASFCYNFHRGRILTRPKPAFGDTRVFAVSNPGDPYNSQSLVRYLETLDTSRILPLHGTYHIPGLEKNTLRQKKRITAFCSVSGLHGPVP